ncbi:MAG: hypothetical protein ACFFFG_11805 [Candidatus Thorarchaeota archaeon]
MRPRRYVPGGLIEFFPQLLLSSLTRFLNDTDGFVLITPPEQFGAYLALIEIYLEICRRTLPDGYLTTINQVIGVPLTRRNIIRQQEIFRPIIPNMNHPWRFNR